MSDSDFTALTLTIKLALSATLVLLILGTPLAWWLAKTQSRLKVLIEAMVALPLVLPPTVLGFYLLIFLGSNGPLFPVVGSLAFTFEGLVLGSVIYSLPFVVQPIQNAFSSVPQKQLEAASLLGASKWQSFWRIAVPQARLGFLTAIVLGIAHTLGEFGVVLMIGGNIVGETQVVSIAIFEHVESLQYGHAHFLSATLLIISFVMLLLVYSLNGGVQVFGSKRIRSRT